MINHAVLVGRLTKNPELKSTANGNHTCSFTLAVNRRNPDQPTDFINCVAWNKAADNLCQYMSKGSLIGIVGRIQTRNYQNQQGNTVYITEVLANEITFLEKKNQGDNQNNYQNNTAYANTDRNDSYQEQNTYAGIDMGYDDLPF